MSAVRLFRWAHEDNRWFVPGSDPPTSMGSEWVALPAAEHAKLVALLGEAREMLEAFAGFGVERRCDMMHKIDAALAGLDGRAK